MASCNQYCAEELTDFEYVIECGSAHPAGASNIIVVICDDLISDPFNATQLLAAIAAGDAFKVEGVRFGSTAPTPTPGPKLTSCGVESVLYQTHAINWTDYNYTQVNNLNYERLGNGLRPKGVLAIDCTKTGWDDTARYYASNTGGIQLSGGLVSPDDDNEASRFELAGSFKGTIDIGTAPTGIF